MLQEASETADSSQQSLPLGLIALVGLNLIPLFGVLNWGWQSFDLIFLYWMENLVIGAFTFLRMVARPYGHPLELIVPLFFAPFFVLHYGAFCWGHGTFVVGLFGSDNLNGFNDLVPGILSALGSPTMLFALAALASIQALDWVRDVRARGFGSDSVMLLMLTPYRRILVLHLTIIAAGFALAAMNEPLLGLVILVVVKTVSDVWHWRKDVELEKRGGAFLFTPELLAKMREKHPRPTVKVNGKEKEFESFAELADSKEFRMASSLMRVIGAGQEIKALEAYMETRSAEEQAQAN